jgi:hypothetical protein
MEGNLINKIEKPKEWKHGRKNERRGANPGLDWKRATQEKQTQREKASP